MPRRYHYYLDPTGTNKYIDFERSFVRRNSIIKEKLTPFLLESLHYLDLQLDQMEDCHSFERPFSRRGWIKYFRYQLLDQLGVDWDQRIEKRNADQVRKVLGLRRRNFMNFCLESMVLSIYNIILLQTDHLTAITRRYMKPLWYTQQLRSENNRDMDITFFILFFRLLRKYSSDSQLLVDFLGLLFSESKFRHIMLAMVPVQRLDYLLRHSQKARFSLWGVFSAFADQENGKHLIPGYIIQDSVEVISTLVKYGAAVEKAMIQLPMENAANLHLSTLWPYIDQNDMDSFSLFWNLRSRSDIIMNQIAYYAMMSNAKLITLEHAQTCIQLIWRSLPDVYPTTQQLENHTVSMLVRTRTMWTIYRIPESVVCDFYKDTVSGSASENPRPRSLKQYCRCALRKQLVKSSHLPEGISSLGLAPRLERYLRLEY